jgi:hypothetical protein
LTHRRGGGSSLSEMSTSRPLRRSHARSSADSGIASAASSGRSTHVNPGGITDPLL